jgi:hypothetical protein
MNSTQRSKRTIAGLAGAALLAFPLAACGDDAGGNAPAAVATVEDVTGNQTQVTLDQGFVDALGSLKLTPGVLGEAKLEDGALKFPITGGNVSVFTPGEVSPYVIGQLFHDTSGLTLTAGDTTVELNNFVVDPAFSKVYADVEVNDEVAAQHAYVFQLDGRTLKPVEVAGGVATLEGTKVMISEVAAGLLNDVFKTDAVTPGLLVGIAKIDVATS